MVISNCFISNFNIKTCYSNVNNYARTNFDSAFVYDLVITNWQTWPYSKLMSWDIQSAAGIRLWKSIASSADGSRLAAVEFKGFIYTSADYGIHWVVQTNTGPRRWNSIVSSADGSRLAAVESGGFIYMSADYGTNWSVWTNAGSLYWKSVASSADGSRLAAITSMYIYTSSDYGLTWKDCSISGSYNWSSLASSDDGRHLIVADNGGYIYTTSDYGANWEIRKDPGSRSWQCVASSSDGRYLVAAAGDMTRMGDVYTSEDYGAHWTDRKNAGERYWHTVTSSADGSHLAAGPFLFGSYIWTSADFGVHWTELTGGSVYGWQCIVLSADGSRLAAVFSGFTDGARMKSDTKHSKLLTAGLSGISRISGNMQESRDIKNSLIKTIKDQNLQAIVEEEGVNEIKLNISDVLFELDSSKVNQNYTKTIKSITEMASKYSNLNVLIEGYTDDLGDGDYNVKLSGSRAMNVAQLFIAYGMPSARISYRGLGKQNPIAPNDSSENRKKNRRVEIRFIENK